MLRLYTYFRSSAAYRVRIALALKGLAYDSVPVHLLRGGGEQLQAAYRAVNPAALVPALQDGGATLTQSLALLLEYLEETHPAPALLPQGAVGRARVRAGARRGLRHPPAEQPARAQLPSPALCRPPTRSAPPGYTTGWRWAWKPSRQRWRATRRPACAAMETRLPCRSYGSSA